MTTKNISVWDTPDSYDEQTHFVIPTDSLVFVLGKARRDYTTVRDKYVPVISSSGMGWINVLWLEVCW